jgi:photoactive yellow protein
MFEPPSSSVPSSAPPQSLDERSDADLDALPYGVVCLDAEGTILRYNLAESRWARLDRNQVLGRKFFTEVAPCTCTEAFEGRFSAFVASSAGAPGRVERFDYFFDFKFGGQEVSVEILRAVSAPRYYLLINRRRAGGPRDVPPAQLAPAQRDLAPDEPRLGVLRDDLERRYAFAPSTFFAALRATCDALAPETWPLFASEWGVAWGRRVAVDLEASALEKSGRSLRELSMREVARVSSAYLSERGWGSPRFDFAAASEGLVVIEIDRSALAEAAPRSRGAAAPGGDLACHLLAGALASILSSVAGRRLAGREVACVAAGAPRCAIVVTGHERRAAVDAALGEGLRGVDAVRAALRRAGRPPEGSR